MTQSLNIVVAFAQPFIVINCDVVLAKKTKYQNRISMQSTICPVKVILSEPTALFRQVLTHAAAYLDGFERVVRAGMFPAQSILQCCWRTSHILLISH